MSKSNNKLLELFLYIVICLSIGFLIYNSCKITKTNKIVEGLTNKQEETQDSPQGKEYDDFFQAIGKAATGGIGTPETRFGWKPNAANQFKGSPLPSTLPWIRENMDICGNLNNTLNFIHDSRELTRLIGINELATNWSNLNPVFMQYYKDKMYFLNDIEKYIKTMCIKNGVQCSSPNGGGQWWNPFGDSGSNGSNSGSNGDGDNWWSDISDQAQQDIQGATDAFNSMDNMVNQNK